MTIDYEIDYPFTRPHPAPRPILRYGADTFGVARRCWDDKVWLLSSLLLAVQCLEQVSWFDGTRKSKTMMMNLAALFGSYFQTFCSSSFRKASWGFLIGLCIARFSAQFQQCRLKLLPYRNKIIPRKLAKQINFAVRWLTLCVANSLRSERLTQSPSGACTTDVWKEKWRPNLKTHNFPCLKKNAHSNILWTRFM